MKRVYSRGLKKKKDESDLGRKAANSDYFDDCYVCQMTKKAEEEGKSLSLEELKEIFRKANEQN